MKRRRPTRFVPPPESMPELAVPRSRPPEEGVWGCREVEGLSKLLHSNRPLSVSDGLAIARAHGCMPLQFGVLRLKEEGPVFSLYVMDLPYGNGEWPLWFRNGDLAPVR